MDVTAEKIRSYRLRAHHLDHTLPMERMTEAAGVCGLQNSPPGAWETALWVRSAECTVERLQAALYREKTLLQAWSWRGVPVVFPTDQSGVFLAPLVSEPGEEPWIYTRGITLALDAVGMTFQELLPLVEAAAAYLDGHTVKSKEALDQVLAEQVRERLPPEKHAAWDAPSMYGRPDRQTVGGAAVSFLLRPCSFRGLVVFGERQGISPTFTSFRRWVGHEMTVPPDADRALVRKFLHSYGPTTREALGEWLGCSPRQAARLWAGLSEEMVPVRAAGRDCWMLEADVEALREAEDDGERLLLLGAHDPYLGLRDRALILEDPKHQRAVWKTVGEPGVVLRGGRVAGTWTVKTRKEQMDVSMIIWGGAAPAERRTLEEQAEAYAAFRLRRLGSCAIAQEQA